MQTLLQVVVGSKAYGLDNDQSDTDIATVFAYPTDVILALQTPQGTEQPPNLQGDGQDSGVWEVKKFMQMCMSGNPTVLETLWAPTVITTNEFGQQLREQRQQFLSRRVIAAYHGYAKQQSVKLERKYIEEGGMTYQMCKHLAHMCRLMLAGIYVVQNANIMVEIPIEQRQHILNIKHGKIDRQRVMQYFHDLEQSFDTAVATCILPEHPNVNELNNLLLRIRHAY